jgi:hypothetical protein
LYVIKWWMFEYVWINTTKHFQQYFSYIVAVSFIGGENRRKPPDNLNFIT